MPPATALQAWVEARAAPFEQDRTRHPCLFQIKGGHQTGDPGPDNGYFHVTLDTLHRSQA